MYSSITYMEICTSLAWPPTLQPRSGLEPVELFTCTRAAGYLQPIRSIELYHPRTTRVRHRNDGRRCLEAGSCSFCAESWFSPTQISSIC